MVGEHNPELAALGRAIRARRHDLGLSIAALASQAGVAHSSLSRIELGHANPRWNTVSAIATTLDIPIPALLRPGLSVDAILDRHGERRMTPGELREHFGQLPADGEG